MTPKPSRVVAGLTDGALLVALAAVVLAVTYVYVGTERFFYYWDTAVFQDVAWKATVAFGESWRGGLREVARSFDDDYNALFALPLVPILGVLGASRMVYELSSALVYVCPFALSVGALAATLAPEPTRLAFWTGAWITLTIPIAWVPTLRGYPDAGAATLVVLALCVHLREDDSRSLRRAALVGALLAAAVLFRRHFAYAVFAFAASAVIWEALPVFARGPRDGGPSPARSLGRLLLRMVVGALAGTLLACAVGWGFVRRLSAYDFGALYHAYEQPPLLVLRWYAAPYGWIVLAAALAGLILGVRTGLLDRPRIGFLAVYSAFSVVQWVLAVRQLGEQYTLHFTPVVAVGVASLARQIPRVEPRGLRPAAAYSLALLVGANAVFGLSTLDPAPRSPVRGLFAGGWMPLVRWDYDTVAALIECLRRTAKPDEGIFVVASSPALNADLVRHAECELHGRGNARLDVLNVPTIDSRDHYPLGELLEAAHVVLVRPFQAHLLPTEQQVLKIVYDIFTTKTEIGEDFSARPETFTLIGGETISILSRRRPTPLSSAIRAFEAMERQLPARPGTQPDWIVVSRRFPSWLYRRPDGSTSWVAHPSKRDDVASTALAYIGRTFAAGEIEGTVEFIDPRCQGATVAVSTADPDGRLTPLAAVALHPGAAAGFHLKVVPGGRRLVLNLLDYAAGASIDYCLLRLDPLIVRPGAD